METVDWRSSSSQAKCLGAVVSIAGAFVVTLYKGPPIAKNVSLNNIATQLLFSSQSEWILGGLFIASDCLVSSLWYILQVRLLVTIISFYKAQRKSFFFFLNLFCNFLQASTQKKYPAVLLTVLYQTSFSTFIAAVFSLIAVKDISAWKLKLDMGLVAILYTVSRM